VVAPSLKKMPVGLAVVPLYAEYFVFSLQSNGSPLHSSSFVSILAKRFSIDMKNADYRVTLADRNAKCSDELVQKFFDAVAPLDSDADLPFLLEFLMNTRDTQGRVRFLANLQLKESVKLSQQAVSLLKACCEEIVDKR
jgi:hypothetical protein